MTLVLLDIEAGVATLTLNRPERMNAFGTDMHMAAQDAMDRIETDPSVRVLVITGAGRGFCAGADLAARAAELEQGEVDIAAALEAGWNRLIRRLAALPVPVIASVNGVAAGAGASLALAADIVIAGRSARFQFSFVKVGLGPDAGASWTLPRLIGLPRAMAMMMTAEPVSAERAESWGLIWRCVDEDSLAGETAALAAGLAAAPRGALTAIRRSLRAAANTSLDASLDAERDGQSELGRSADYHEAVAAFAAKRPPRFG